MNFMPSCRAVAEASSSEELPGLGVWRRSAVRWHLFRCRDCRTYVKQIRAIGLAARGMLVGEAAEPEVLERLEARILETLADGPRPDRPPFDA